MSSRLRRPLAWQVPVVEPGGKAQYSPVPVHCGSRVQLLPLPAAGTDTVVEYTTGVTAPHVDVVKTPVVVPTVPDSQNAKAPVGAVKRAATVASTRKYWCDRVIGFSPWAGVPILVQMWSA